MVERPICPNCGKPAILTDDRYDGKYECPDCDMWAWGGKPLRTRQENNELRRNGGRPKRKVVDLIWDDNPAWATVLGVDYPATIDQVTAAYRRKVIETHPDNGGDVDAFQRIVEAMKAAREELSGGLFAGKTIAETDWSEDD